MRRILKYCARSNQGIFYQQQSARAMAYENRLMLWQTRDGEEPM
jgi:hypothetical protein